MINIDIRAWIVGAVVTFTSAFGFVLGDRVMQPLLTFAHTQTLPADAWSVINLLLDIWRPSMVLMAIAGLVYIVYSSLPVQSNEMMGRY